MIRLATLRLERPPAGRLSAALLGSAGWLCLLLLPLLLPLLLLQLLRALHQGHAGLAVGLVNGCQRGMPERQAQHLIQGYLSRQS